MVWQGSISLMAKFILLITEWKKYTQESWNRIKLEWFTCRPEMQRGMRTLMLCHSIQREPPCFLNSLWRICGAGSNLSLRLGQKLICNGIICTISIIILGSYVTWQCFIRVNSACYHSVSKNLSNVRGLSALCKEGSLGQVRNPKPWEASLLKGRVTWHFSCCSRRAPVGSILIGIFMKWSVYQMGVFFLTVILLCALIPCIFGLWNHL